MRPDLHGRHHTVLQSHRDRDERGLPAILPGRGIDAVGVAGASRLAGPLCRCSDGQGVQADADEEGRNEVPESSHPVSWPDVILSE